MCPEFGPPILHDGRGCPLAIGTVIRVTIELEPDDFVTEVTTVLPNPAGAWFWEHWLLPFEDGTLCGRVVAYAIKRPDALAQLRALAAEPTAPQRTPVPA